MDLYCSSSATCRLVRGSIYEILMITQYFDTTTENLNFDLLKHSNTLLGQNLNPLVVLSLLFFLSNSVLDQQQMVIVKKWNDSLTKDFQYDISIYSSFIPRKRFFENFAQKENESRTNRTILNSF